MNINEYNKLLAEYRKDVPEWSDAKFQAAVDQACDESNGVEDSEYFDEFFGHLDGHVNGSIPVSYFED